MCSKEGASKPLIIWVEDDSDFQEIVKEWMAKKFDLVTYNDGGAFLEEMSEIEPAAFILDVRLPGPDGFKLCRAIRGDKRFSATPILFLTASQDDIDYIHHLDVGGTAYLTKPVDREMLLNTLDEITAQDTA